jgi:hypothetical protein
MKQIFFNHIFRSIFNLYFIKNIAFQQLCQTCDLSNIIASPELLIPALYDKGKWLKLYVGKFRAQHLKVFNVKLRSFYSTSGVFGMKSKQLFFFTTVTHLVTNLSRY